MRWMPFWRRDDELKRELHAYIEEETSRLTEAGMPAKAARAAARRKLGNPTRIREQVYESSPLAGIESLRQDVRYAWRLLVRSPGLAAAAVGSLALALGANVLVFSVANALSVGSLPLEQPGRLVFVQSSSGSMSHSFPNYRDFRDRNDTLSGIVGYRIAPMSLEDESGARRIWGYLATTNYFEVLGARPGAGRFFGIEDGSDTQAPPVAVISHSFWLARFGGDERAVGQTITINRLPFTIVGVAPRGFHGTEAFFRPDVWVPMGMQPLIEPGNPWLDNRSTWNTWVIGRLKPGATRQQAEANLNAIAAQLAREYPDNSRNLAVQLVRPGMDAVGLPAAPFTRGLLVLAGLVLLAGCANLAGILLARGADRQREMALRTSLGAGRGRLVRQILTETLLLALAGGVVGFLLAWLGGSALSSWRAPVDVPVQLDVRPNLRVFAFAFGAAILAGVLASVIPARQAFRTAPQTALRGPVDSPLPGRRLAARDVLVAVQLTLCVALVSASLLALRGLQHALVAPIGVERDHAVVAGVDLALAGYDANRGREFQERALERAQRLPGVEAAAYANTLPLFINQSSTVVFAEQDAAAESGRTVTYYRVSPGFFRAMGTRLVAGRDFETRDDSSSPRVAVVNQTFVRTVLGEGDAVGKRFRYGRTGPLIQVIGVVEDGKYRSLTEAPLPVVYRPIRQAYDATTMLVVRSTLPSDDVAAALRRVIADLDPSLPVFATGSLRAMLDFVLLPARAAALALSAFGVLALSLAVTGIHGLVAYAVARRRRELGVRIAVGATSRQIIVLVARRVAVLTVFGIAFGLLLSIAAGQVLAAIVGDVSPLDPWPLGSVAAVMALTALVSCWGPVARAVRTDPIAALRCD